MSDEKMKLPDGETCGDCVSITRCERMFGGRRTNTFCDFYPIRFNKLPVKYTVPDIKSAMQAVGIEKADIGKAIELLEA